MSIPALRAQLGLSAAAQRDALYGRRGWGIGIPFVWIGDSLVRSILGNPTNWNIGGVTATMKGMSATPTGNLAGTNGVVSVIGGERNSTGTGTLSYTAATKALTWAAAGDSAGTPKVIDRDYSSVLLPSATAGKGLYVSLRPTQYTPPAVDTVDTTVTIGTRAGGFQPCIQAQMTCFADLVSALVNPTYRCVGKFATSGNKLPMMTTQMADVMALKPQEAWVMLGTNDCGAGVSLATMESNLSSIVSQLIAGGVRVRLISIMPRGDLGAQALIHGLNRYQRQLARASAMVTYHEHYYDTIAKPAVYGTTSPFDIDTTLYQGDQLHFAGKGSLLFGKSLAADICGTLPTRVAGSYGTYDATNNPLGNLIQNAQMLPTYAGLSAGTFSGANLSGSLPPSWNLWDNGGGGNAVASIVSRQSANASDPQTGYWFLATTNAPFTGVVTMYQTLAMANFSALDQVQVACDSLFTDPTKVTSFAAYLEFVNFDRYGCTQIASRDTVPQSGANTQVTLLSPVGLIPAAWPYEDQAGNPTVVRFRADFVTSNTCSIGLGNVEIRKIT